jgi:hypothetical protein
VAQSVSGGDTRKLFFQGSHGGDFQKIQSKFRDMYVTCETGIVADQESPKGPLVVMTFAMKSEGLWIRCDAGEYTEMVGGQRDGGKHVKYSGGPKVALAMPKSIG